ncbi:MAG: class I SAM-dependent methyltransferase [Candidatus Diapherotrites archaeon]
MRREIVRKYLQKYSLGIVESENSLQLYDFFFKNMGFKESIANIIEKKTKEKEKVLVLDIGCGNAGFLLDLKKIFKEKIETIGIDLLVPQNKPDKIIAGDALDVDFPKNVDFVFSFRALHEIGEPEKIVKKTYESLAEQGKAFLSFRTSDLYSDKQGIAEIQEKEIKELQEMVSKGFLENFKVSGFEVVLGKGKEEILAGVNIFLEK